MSQTLFGRRRLGSPVLAQAGGRFSGVVLTDPSGRIEVAPFTGDVTDVLRGDGTFGPAAADVAVGLELLWDEELGNYVVPR